jgi:hypothetical protein
MEDKKLVYLVYKIQKKKFRGVDLLSGGWSALNPEG